ncbi:hypothetical protein PVAND_015253 [Polypedilum vanderplanki]|uniref:Methyltransferase type 11 domain-containing protein n=1 Tax=Polypedilum vanderplanki TaxID=319348 RepID=A0A9J6BBM3_POLVA|nr:hypothetical protein PVAND_015253 [Polypedilum vanderplanki]
MEFKESYSKNNNLQFRDALNFIKRHKKFFNEHFGEKSLKLADIGTGCGKILNDAVLNESGLNFSFVVGIDKSVDLIKKASEKYKSEKTEFLVRNIEDDWIKDEYLINFDLIFSNYTFHWIKNHEKAFENIHQMLNPGGLFCFTFFHSSVIFYIWETLINSKYTKDKSFISDFLSNICFNEDGEKILKKTLEKSGFKIIAFDDERLDFDFGPQEKFDGKKCKVFHK